MTNLQKLRELTDKLPSLMGSITVSPDGTEMLIEGREEPYIGLLKQPSCGICQAKHKKGDTQPPFYIKEKVIMVMLDGHVNFTTVHDKIEKHHDLKKGDVAIIEPKSQHLGIDWKEDGESLFITIPCWEGTPEVKK